jgi:hypothetical protein
VGTLLLIKFVCGNNRVCLPFVLKHNVCGNAQLYIYFKVKCLWERSAIYIFLS